MFWLFLSRIVPVIVKLSHLLAVILFPFVIFLCLDICDSDEGDHYSVINL